MRHLTISNCKLIFVPIVLALGMGIASRSSVRAETCVWDDFTDIQCAGITAPANNSEHTCDAEVTCMVAAATDQDHKACNWGNSYIGDELTYTWSATAGTFKNGNTGQSVIWVAPPLAKASVTITCVVDDVASIPEWHTGERDDPPLTFQVSVSVVCPYSCASS